MSPLVFPSAEDLARALVAATEVAAAEAIARRGRYTCALTGGSASRLLYPALSRAAIDWPRVHLFYADERCVPAGDPESNHGLALRALGATGAVFHPVDGAAAPERAAAAYTAPWPLDAVHLGMGPDGHVCSLFPGHALLRERAARVAWLTDSPKPPPARVTLTLKALAEARALLFLVLGDGKAGAVKAALEDPGSALPAALASRSNPNSQWYLDLAAASALA